ncbi:hypothetical protein FBZ96_105655 [Bradyrhizobium stylosanthis]|uniref:Uncharacterized protein n=2 Tax=Bradyrhizobium stylosanthis TaxID=1803665 RepID=A0A560DPE2_9BRAD|nr:hypothetical protein FBZ96_105655 [Bradyrhizobium stylosanthis]
MNRVLLGAIAFIALAASAAVLAAKPHVKASPPVIPSHDWSGFYIGINGGGFSAHQCWETVNADGVVVAPPVDMGYHNATGGTVGGQIGYRRLIANSLFAWKLRAVGLISMADANLAFAGVLNESKFDAFDLVTGQVVRVWNSVLLYLKGGAAVVRDKCRVFDFASISHRDPESLCALLLSQASINNACHFPER